MDDNKNYETEIDFKKLPKSPSRLFGWIFPYYAFLFVVVGIYFVKNMDYASFNSVPAIYTDSLEINADVEVKKGGIMPAIDLNILSNSTPELIEKGKTLYATNCASCHGTEGKGDGVAAVALKPPPRNFHSVDGWSKGTDLPNMFTSIQKGITGTGMIGYDFIPLEDRIALIHFIRTFAEYPAISDEQVAQLDKEYELSKGINSPNNISLEMAVEKISEENSILDLDDNALLSNIKSNYTDIEITLFNNIASNRKKAIAIFKRDYDLVKDSNVFIERVLQFPNENGFKQNVTMLSKEDLVTIHKLLSSIAI